MAKASDECNKEFRFLAQLLCVLWISFAGMSDGWFVKPAVL